MREGKTVRPRKEPIQRRSRKMKEDILEAATRVLTKEGIKAFNTNRIAAVAGVSVGSLYQYFPNKESLLYQLKQIEDKATWRVIDAILSSKNHKPRDRIRRAIHAFFSSEMEEASLRKGLQHVDVFFENIPGYRDLESKVIARLSDFLREISPPDSMKPDFEARLILLVVTGIAGRITDENPSSHEVHRWASACSDMLCDYLHI